eukprot:TRINITY_DN593_c0_g1_i2.p2 TRINITY_DN593_c0_g1~~TRINITY_DN593_c0_g1_i2.p2  ORF type:complete len:101 (+),score=6.61 TRINITY_DN593_c0_g1_i2:736-1038(+)
MGATLYLSIPRNVRRHCNPYPRSLGISNSSEIPDLSAVPHTPFLYISLYLSLSLSLSLSSVSSYKTTNDQSALVFASIFVIVWCGAAVVTANALLLGGTM